ncbi:YHYH protein [Granulosicoccus sp.]|nr:YHYH protein [Granulosicoccus sp.]MDB4223332.1 YHYH protein [Granulosicoccus sp.]
MNRSTQHQLSLHRLILGLSIIAAATNATFAQAHDDDQHCAAVTSSVTNAGFANTATVSCEAGQAIITSDTYPDHTLMTGIVGSNEQLPVPAKDYAAPIPLQPKLGEIPQTRDAALGVAVNGVPIYDYTGGGEMSLADLTHHQTQHDTLLTKQLDVCGGHAGRGDDYHYHVKPVCMIEQMDNAGDDAIIGWAYDGFPIYGDNNPDGTPIAMGVLDVCNGQQDDTFGYRYHTSTSAPYIVQCLMGEVADMRELPRVRPLSPSAGGGGSKPGKPPRGGVDNLVFTQNSAGLRSMEYSYQGEDYYMRYSPSDTPDCYQFETRTVTNNGEIKTGEYCR